MMEQKAFISTWCTTFMHTSEKDVFFLNALKISLAPTPREGPHHVMFVRNSHVFRDSRCYENDVCINRLTNQFLLDNGVTLGENIVFVLGYYDYFSVFHLLIPAL